MRHVFWGLVLVALCGCSRGDTRPPLGGPTGSAARPQRWEPTAESMVAYLNENSRRITALQADDVVVDCKQGRDSAAVTGRLDCMRPRNFRLTGRAVGQPQVDIGSNDQEFWYWIARSQPPYVYHCSHEALARGNVRLHIPFQPDLVLTALGLGEYDPNKKYEVRSTGNTVELIEWVPSPQGQSVQKVTVFNRAAKGDQPTVAAHILRDTSGKKICEATITHAIHDRSGAELPRRITLVWPEQQIEMKMNLDKAHVVRPEQEEVARLYSRRVLASQRSFDLERGTPDDRMTRQGAPDGEARVSFPSR